MSLPLAPSHLTLRFVPRRSAPLGVGLGLGTAEYRTGSGQSRQGTPEGRRARRTFVYRIGFYAVIYTHGTLLGYNTSAAFGSLPDLYGPYERVATFGTGSLLVGVSAMTVGGTENVVLVETVGLL